MVRPGVTRTIQALLMLSCLGGLTGCGAAAAPCRLGSALLKAVPFVGHTVATPTDACADAIDPSESGS